MANHKEGFTADGTKILPGQFMTSQIKLASEFKVSRSKMQRLLEKLKTDQQIEIKSSHHNSIITVVNWHIYQGDDRDSEQLPGSKRAPVGHLSGTNKNNNNNKNNINHESEKNLPEIKPKDFRNPEDLINSNLFAVDSIHPLEEKPVSDLERNVLTAMNSILGKNFRPVAANLKLIKARIKEGYTLEDFAAVFKHKLESWGNDPVMKSHLIPSTLLGGKFDGYLQAAMSAQKPSVDPLEAFFLEHSKGYMGELA